LQEQRFHQGTVMLESGKLRRLPFFAGLRAEALRELEIRGVERRYGKHQTLFRAGTPSPGIYVVLDGLVQVVREGAGRRHVVHTEGAGATLAEIPLFAGGDLPATAVALRPTRCLLFTREAILAGIARDPELALLLLAQLAGRVRQVVERLDRLASLTVRGRLVDYLQQRAMAARGAFYRLEGTQTELAEVLGTVREVLVRELRSLHRLGVLVRTQRGVLRVSLPRLRGYAGRLGLRP
jgi:CRP/FNR family transcriptional regulator